MKKVFLWLILILISVGYTQYEPVFKYRNNGGRANDNWTDSLKTFVWHSAGDDTTITSISFAPRKGFDGLRQFMVRIDSLGDDRDGENLIIRNFTRPEQEKYYQKTVIIDTTTIFNIFFIYQSFLGESLGWVDEDTLEWSLRSDTTRVTTTTTLTLSEENTIYTSLFRPYDSDGERGYGIWQTDVPVPWRVVGYFPHVQASDSNTVFIKLECADHTPNSGSN